MGASSSSSVHSKIINDVLTESFLSVTNSCKTDVDLSQTLNIDVTSSSENSSQCARCFDVLVDRQQQTYAVIRESWDRANMWSDIVETFGGPPLKLKPDPNEGERLAADAEACKLACKSMIVDEVTQTNMFKWNTTCEFNSTMMNEMTNEISAKTKQALVSKKDVLAAIGDVLGKGSADEVTNDIVNRITNKINLTFMNEMLTVVRAQQTLDITGTSTSTKNIAQFSSVKGVSELFAKTNVATAIFSDQEIEAYQKSYSQNTTISDAGDAVARGFASISGVVNTQMFIGFMSALVLLCVMLLVLIIMIIQKMK
jgi:hypothetical protein